MYRPPQCTEREPNGAWTDCTWASGVMLGNAAYARTQYPPTQAEYEALRKASGDFQTPTSPGSNYNDLDAGMLNRWAWMGEHFHKPLTFERAWMALEPGQGGAIQGSMGAFPAGHRLRRWDPRFHGGHSVYVQREDVLERVWWMNPQAPNSYPGEWITKAELRAYFTGLPGAELVTVEIGSRSGAQETDMPFAYKAERWLLDGGPGKVTTLGAPLKSDGTPDFSKRLALVSGKGGVNPQLAELARTRLSAPTDELTDEFWTALTTYTIATGGAASFNAGVEAAAAEALTAKQP